MLSPWTENSDIPPPEEKTDFRGPFYGFTLKSSTWLSDSHGLYDYETHNVAAKTYRCHGRCKPAERETDCGLSPTHFHDPPSLSQIMPTEYSGWVWMYNCCLTVLEFGESVRMRIVRQ